jgi:toluene monooxygenase system protein B
MTDTTANHSPLGPEDRAPEPVPLCAVFDDDFVAFLCPVTTAFTMDEVAEAVAFHTEGRRVRAENFPKIVIHDGQVLPGDMTVAEAGIVPMDFVRVDYDRSAATDTTGAAS